jgi:hypothetical protein
MNAGEQWTWKREESFTTIKLTIAMGKNRRKRLGMREEHRLDGDKK